MIFQLSLLCPLCVASTCWSRAGSTFLSPGINSYSDLLTDEPVSQLKQYNTLNLVVTIGAIGALLAFYLLVYAPLVRRLDNEIKDVRRLLLLYPDEVSRNTAAIINAGRDMLKDSQSVSGGSVASAGFRGPMHH